ncbi:hypothetical protein AB6A40_011281 [Gnathostoma spinigerum]|uniref:Uncharacterized protein n=1 Tax=Gnathostoma spinigerum TaxID=75299 RepID=A0ABD6F3U8_9BILA
MKRAIEELKRQKEMKETEKQPQSVVPKINDLRQEEQKLRQRLEEHIGDVNAEICEAKLAERLETIEVKEKPVYLGEQLVKEGEKDTNQTKGYKEELEEQIEQRQRQSQKDREYSYDEANRINFVAAKAYAEEREERKERQRVEQEQLREFNKLQVGQAN